MIIATIDVFVDHETTIVIKISIEEEEDNGHT
jgi:hypothetical protein